MIDGPLRIAGDASVATLVLLQHTVEVQSAVDVLHVLREFLVLALLDPLNRRVSSALRLARYLRGGGELQAFIDRLRREFQLLLDRENGGVRE